MAPHCWDKLTDERGVDLLRLLQLSVTQEADDRVDAVDEPVQFGDVGDGSLVDLKVWVGVVELGRVPYEDFDPCPSFRAREVKCLPVCPVAPNTRNVFWGLIWSSPGVGL